VANPIGLAQTLLHDQMGRFDFASGENFNRLYTDFAPLIQNRLLERLNDDPNTTGCRCGRQLPKCWRRRSRKPSWNRCAIP